MLLSYAAAPARAVPTADTPPIVLALPTASETAVLLGYSVAAARGQIAAAAPHTIVEDRERAGAVLLFEARSGTHLHTLRSPLPAFDENFGFAVAIDDTHVLVGAPRATVDGAVSAGAAYLFDRESGALVRVVHEPRPAAHHEFGLSVALGQGQIAIGAPGATSGAVAYAGAVYLFATERGTLVHRLAAPTPRTSEAFAQALAMAGRALAVGAPLATVPGGARAGRVDIFDARTGSWLRRLHAPTPAPDARFGFALALRGARVLVGAPGIGGEYEPRGRAHLIHARTGVLTQTFAPPHTPPKSELFGYAVAFDHRTVIVGAPDAARPHHVKAGAAYLFRTTTGRWQATLHEPIPTSLSQFGLAVTTIRGMPVIGAQRARSGGAVYLYRP